jgi:hypothetical protein
MKNNMKFYITFFLALFSLLNIKSYSQPMATYVYNYHNLKFQVPETFEVIKNSDKAFVARGNGIVVEVYPFSDERYSSATQVAKVSYDNFGSLNKKVVDEGIVNINSFSGYFFSGTANKRSSGVPIEFFSVGCLNPADYSNFYAYIYYEAINEEEAEQNHLLTLKILNTFSPIRF